MKSSKSSSAATELSSGLVIVLLPFETDGFGGVLGGRSSAPKSNKSSCGSGCFGVSAFLVSRRIGVDVSSSGFRRLDELPAPSSYSSYSSNRSLLLLVS